MAQVMRWMCVGLALVVVASCKPTSQSFDPQRTQPQYGAYPPGAQHTQSGALPMPHSQAEPLTDNHLPPVSRTVKVGFLAPLSGRSAAVGQALRDAGTLALFDKYSSLSGPAAGIRVELITKDTKGTSQGARQAAADAMKEGAELLIGPLFSHAVESIKPLAATGKVSILTFSNNKAVAGNGVFTVGFNPDQQAKRIARYTFLRDVNRMAVFAPNDAYGRQVTKAVEKEVTLLGRDVAPNIAYSPAGTSLAQDVNRLMLEGSMGGRATFEALFLPEGGEKLGPILNALAKENINPRTVQFVGTGLWDDRDLIRLYDLEGAWLASSPPNMYEAFEQRFINTYNYKPPRIASLAYDAVALAATMATSGLGFDRQVITDPSGYYGPANGIFRFHSDGTVERGLAVMQVQNGGFNIIDPAPTMFGQ